MVADIFAVPVAFPVVVALALAYGMTGVGVALAFFIAEPRSPSTRWLSLAVAMSGVAVAVTTIEAGLHPDGRGVSWYVQVPVTEVILYFSLALWTLSVAAAVQPTRRALIAIRALAATYLATGSVYFVQASLDPEGRLTQFLGCMGQAAGCTASGFWKFGVWVSAALLSYVLVWVILFFQRIDHAERHRAIAVAISGPFFFSVYVLPLGIGTLSSLVGAMIFLIGAMRYHVTQGERGQFMSRFLSPQVARLVRQQGLESTLKSQTLDITVVCCDLRGFTRLSQLLASDQVVRLLGEYYDAVGVAVAEQGATIKDYAGDGILILVGAPLPVPDHAARGLALARRIRLATTDLIRHWAGPEMKLGIGIGVASGPVIVGVIGSTTARLEYTAVGPAVNLASRLCEESLDQEVLVDTRTFELARTPDLQARDALTLKGFGETRHYALG